MLKIARLTVALAIAGLSIPALAQASKDGFAYAGAEESGSQLQQYRYFTNEENEAHPVWRQAAPAARSIASMRAAGTASAFTYRGEGTGWEITPHKLAFVNGKLAHSNECDHAIRMVQGPTAKEVDATRNLSPGA